MKSVFAVLVLVLSFHSRAGVIISQINLEREGGGQISAYVRKAPHGIRLIVSKCNFEDYSHHRTSLILDKNLSNEAQAILEGKAVIASDVSFEAPLTQTGSWFKMSYVVDMSQFEFPGGYTPREMKTVEVNRPLIIFDKKVSNILDRLEMEARKLCQN